MRLVVALMLLVAGAPAQSITSNLSSFWEGDPEAGIIYDYHGSAHAFYHPNRDTTATGDIFGDGFTVDAAGRGPAVPASLLNSTGDQTWCIWTRPSGGNAMVVRADGATSYLRIEFNTGRARVVYRNTSGGSEVNESDAYDKSDGELALICAAYDSSGGDWRVAVDDSAWKTHTPSAAWDAANAVTFPVDIGHQAQTFEFGSTIGRMMLWNYILTETDIDTVYNSGAGRDYTYYNASGFTKPTPPLTVSLISSTFLQDTGLTNQGLYWVRPYPVKDWGSLASGFGADYAWPRSKDHHTPESAGDAIYICKSDSPATAPTDASCYEAFDYSDLSTADSGNNWGQLHTPTMVWDSSNSRVLLYHGALQSGSCGTLCLWSSHVWSSTDMTTWTWEGEALPNDGTTSRNHTGYPLVVRRGATDWIAQTLIRDSSNPNGSGHGWWTSTDGLAWTFDSEIPNFYLWPYRNSEWRNYLDTGGTIRLAGLFNGSGGAAYIANQNDSATDPLEAEYPPWHLFDHGGTGSGGDWLQDVRAYEENGVVHVYAKWSYQEPSSIRYYRGTLAGETNLTYSFDADEITELDYLGIDFAQNVNSGVDFLGSVYHNDSETPTTCSPTETLNGDGWTHRCNSGGDKDTEVDVTLSQPDGDSLQMVIVVTNHDVDDDLTRIVLNPLEITNPGANIQSCNNVPRRAGREHGPAFILSGTWGSWTIGMASFPTGWRLTTFCTDADTVDFDIALTNTHAAIIDDPQDVIGPGETATITLIMRFGAAGSDVDDLAPESFSAWRTLFPYRMTWADPRPIATWFLSSEGSVNVTTNPRGFIQSITDWTDQSDFTTKLLAATDTVVSLAQGMSPKPQGLILWDAEGTENPHSYTYVGDPTALCSITPEMCYDVGGTPLIDEMVRRLHAGGLRVGFTLRPQEPIAYGDTKPGSCDAPPTPFDDTAATFDYTDTFIETDLSLSPRGNRGWRCNDSGDGWTSDVLYWQRHLDTNAQVVAELSRKIRYAVDRWRASIFYVDTNNLSGTYSHEIFDALAKEFPDILILPEWETTNYAGSTFPYGELDLGDGGATASEKRLYPQARRILNIMDGDRDANASTIVAAMREGSPTLHRGWFADDSITDTETLYAQARAANGVVTVNGERYETTIPIVERVSGSCYPHEAVVRFASGTETLNGCNIFTEQGCGSTATCASTDSPCTIADRTAYRIEMRNSRGDTCSAGRIGPRLIEIASAGGRVSVNPVTGQLAFDKAVGSYFEVHVADADGSNVTCISCDHADLPTRHIGNPVWSPDGEWIVMQAQKSAATTTDSVSTPGIGVFNDLYAYEVDTDTATLIHSVTLTTPTQGLLHPQFNHAGTQLMWAEMTDGSGGFNGTWKMTIADWNPATPSLSNLTDYTPSSKTFYETHGWSHDDSKIIYTAAAGAFTDLDIWTWDLSGSPTNLTSDVAGAWDEHAHFSRDGRRIVWMSSRGQSFSPLQTDYWVMDADGGRKTRLTNFSNASSADYQGYNAIASDFDWSRDGRIIGYVQQTGTTPDSGKLLSVDAGVYYAPLLQDAAASSCAAGAVQVGDACEPFGAALDLLLGATDR